MYILDLVSCKTCNRMTTIVMTYHNRPESLAWTLESLRHSAVKDFNVLIVNDNSDADIKLPDLPYKVRVINSNVKNDTWSGKYVCVFNMAFFYALQDNPDIIIMQHSECYHKGDIMSYALKEVSKDNYISFGCYALGKDETPDTVKIIDRPCTQDGQRSWYNHPIIRPVGYQFCAAMTAENLIKLNGFDERFKDGVAYEDNYFLHQIKMLGLKVQITDDPIVYHQYHPVQGNRTAEAWMRNQALFRHLSQGNEYRAKHLLTPNL